MSSSDDSDNFYDNSRKTNSQLDDKINSKYDPLGDEWYNWFMISLL